MRYSIYSLIFSVIIAHAVSTSGKLSASGHIRSANVGYSRQRNLTCRRNIAMVSPLGVVSPLVRMYCESLTKAPLVTNCVTAATLSVCSDAIAQKMEVTSASKEQTFSTGVNVFPYDVSRGLWMSGWGFVISGLFVHFWFMFLNSLFPVEGLTLVGALKKVFVNQFFMSPGLNSLFFLLHHFHSK